MRSDPRGRVATSEWVTHVTPRCRLTGGSSDPRATGILGRCHMGGPGGALPDVDLVQHERWTAPPVVAASRGRVRERAGGIRPDLEEVFRADYPRVVGVAARVLGSRDQAEDVAQEVFLAFGRSSVPAGEAGGWLSVAAAHTALNLLRSGRRRTAREEVVGRQQPAEVPDVADAVLSRVEHGRVRAALARLPRKQAVVLVLRHSGLTYDEVAAALDLSVGSVGTTVRRAESRLRKELERDASSD